MLKQALNDVYSARVLCVLLFSFIDAAFCSSPPHRNLTYIWLPWLHAGEAYFLPLQLYCSSD